MNTKDRKAMTIRKLLFFLQAAVLILTSPYVNAAAESDCSELELEAENVLLASLTKDLKTDEFLYESDSEEVIYPGSTIKMLTALTVLDIADPEEKAKVGLEYFLVPSDASKAGLKPLMKLTMIRILVCRCFP